jgi:hypothetical protein
LEATFFYFYGHLDQPCMTMRMLTIWRQFPATHVCAPPETRAVWEAARGISAQPEAAGRASGRERVSAGVRASSSNHNPPALSVFIRVHPWLNQTEIRQIQPNLTLFKQKILEPMTHPNTTKAFLSAQSL